MTEKAFIECIDCKFPYQNSLVWKEIIELGIRISPNAAFAILHEICRPPRSLNIEQPKLLEILGSWSALFNHPLVPLLLPFATSMIRREFVSVEAAAEGMKVVATYPNQYCALAVLYFSCDDVDGEIETLYNQIAHSWQQFDSQKT